MTTNFTAETATANPVLWLKKDHEIIRQLLDELNGPLAGPQATLDRLKGVLALHNAIEENLVYPAIAAAAGTRDQAMALYHETAEADLLIDQVQRAVLDGNSATFEILAQQLMGAIHEHVEFEETKAFPILEAAPASAKRLLAEQILAFKQQTAALAAAASRPSVITAS